MGLFHWIIVSEDSLKGKRNISQAPRKSNSLALIQSVLAHGVKGQRYIGRILWALTGAPPRPPLMSPPTASIRLLAVPPLSLGAAYWQKPQTICLKLSLWRESYSEPLCPGTGLKQLSEGKQVRGGGRARRHTPACPSLGTLRQEDRLRYRPAWVTKLLGFYILHLCSFQADFHQPIPASPPMLSQAASPQGILSS